MRRRLDPAAEPSGAAELLNIEPAATLDLAAAVARRGDDTEGALAAIKKHSLAKLGYREYGRRLGASIVPLAEELGFDSAASDKAGGISVIRCTMMDPFVASCRGEVDFVEEFVRYLGQVLAAELAAPARR